MKNQQTKRPQNKCGSCGHTWYPKGSNLSAKCPQCGSKKTEKVGLGILGTLVLIVLLSVGSHYSDNNLKSPIESVSTMNSPPVIPNDAGDGSNSVLKNQSNLQISSELAQQAQQSAKTINTIDKEGENELGFAEKLIVEKNYSAAKQLIKQLLIKYPDNQRALNLNVVLENQSNLQISPELAQQAQQSVRTANTVDKESENELGFAEKLIDEKNYSAAKQLIRQLLIKYPDNQTALNLEKRIIEPY